MKGFIKNSTYFPFIIIGIVILLVVFFGMKNTTNGSSNNSTISSGDGRVNVKNAKANQVLNKNFAFSLKDQDGKEVSKIQFVILNSELRDEIIVKGQRGAAVNGRTFLILNLKITNSFDKAIQINSRDYVRLTIDNSKEKLAPEIHNDPVEVQAISTKYTRLGFPIDDNQKSLTIEIGEIKGKKEQIKLNLK